MVEISDSWSIYKSLMSILFFYIEAFLTTFQDRENALIAEIAEITRK